MPGTQRLNECELYSYYYHHCDYDHDYCYSVATTIMTISSTGVRH